jgi:ubiquinone/menaquinone biosynthesis C-methylase UbiE
MANTFGHSEEHRTVQDGHGSSGDHGHRTHRFDPANVERLLSDERRQLLPPEDTLRAAGIETGQVVVDLGCGPGYFTLPVAARVGDSGQVYGVDVQPALVDACRRRVQEAGLHNVEVVQSEENRVPLPDAVADRVFVAFVLHETDDPEAFLREARRLLKPTGEIVLVEWQKQDGPPGPPREHRVGRADVIAAAQSATLQVGAQHDLNAYQYLVRLTPTS